MPSREHIIKTCDGVKDLLVRKNANYGNAVAQAPVLAPGTAPGTAILVRMSDKIARFASMARGTRDLVGESAVETMTDLVGYGILWLAEYAERTDENQDAGPREEVPCVDYDGLKCPI